MLTPKENYLAAARGEKPEWVPSFPGSVNLYMPSLWLPDPETMRDWMGVYWYEHEAGMTSDTVNTVLSDVSEWREKIVFPDLAKIDWEGEIEQFKTGEMFDPDKAIYFLTGGGTFFMRPVNALGWEGALTAHYENPEEMKAFIDAITEMVLGMIDNVFKYIQPDIVGTGDDFSFSAGPVIPVDIWNDFYRDNVKRVIDDIHARGALAQFHNCGDNGYLLDECLAIGADIMELPKPTKALEEAKEKYGSRLVIVGGWDRIGEASINPDASEEVVRQSVRDAIDTYGKDGAFAFWDGGLIVNDEKSGKKMEWLNDELEKYGANYYK